MVGFKNSGFKRMFSLKFHPQCLWFELVTSWTSHLPQSLLSPQYSVGLAGPARPSRPNATLRSWPYTDFYFFLSYFYMMKRLTSKKRESCNNIESRGWFRAASIVLAPPDKHAEQKTTFSKLLSFFSFFFCVMIYPDTESYSFFGGWEGHLSQ